MEKLVKVASSQKNTCMREGTVPNVHLFCQFSGCNKYLFNELDIDDRIEYLFDLSYSVTSNSHIVAFGNAWANDFLEFFLSRDCGRLGS